MLIAEIIKAKRDGAELTGSDISELISDFAQDKIPDYQMAAFAMAVYFRGMTPSETLALTEAMISSGDRLFFADLGDFVVDKHSTGGVGDKTSLILGPIVAACGGFVPMMSGRGLGHTGGTLDKLQSIPGMNVFLTLEQFQSQVRNHHLSFIGQSESICPADKRFYALRDVTATVESLPLICASIMSKKIAEGIRGLTLDVKFGSGAFMKTKESAQELALALKSVGTQYGLEVNGLLSNMNQPLGRFIGNALEIRECLDILKGQVDDLGYYNETKILSLQLAAQMIQLGKKIPYSEAYQLAEQKLKSGEALLVFEKTIAAQGGRLSDLQWDTVSSTVLSPKSGFIQSFKTETIGYAAVELGAGRRKSDDIILPGVGIECLKKVGQSIEINEPVFRIYSANKKQIERASERLREAFEVSAAKQECPTECEFSCPIDKI